MMTDDNGNRSIFDDVDDDWRTPDQRELTSQDIDDVMVDTQERTYRRTPSDVADVISSWCKKYHHSNNQYKPYIKGAICSVLWVYCGTDSNLNGSLEGTAQKLIDAVKPSRLPLVDR